MMTSSLSKLPLIIIAGPTATGKSKAAVRLAKKINGQIISADSMQVYKYMNIGTAKPTPLEMDGVKHYMIDILYPDQEFSVAAFKEMCTKYIEQICNEGKIPILVGGTGFYINSVIRNNQFTEAAADLEYREQLYRLAEENGNEYLHNMLKKVDMPSAEVIHFNNVKRVVRALEYFAQTKEPISRHNMAEKERTSFYNEVLIVLNMERNLLYERINRRVDDMITAGLLQEVEELLSMGYGKELISMKAIGYKEIIEHLCGNYSLNTSIEDIKTNSRRFAKRQVTWFKNQTNGIWIDVSEDSDILESKILESIKKAGII